MYFFLSVLKSSSCGYILSSKWTVTLHPGHKQTILTTKPFLFRGVIFLLPSFLI